MTPARNRANERSSRRGDRRLAGGLAGGQWSLVHLVGWSSFHALDWAGGLEGWMEDGRAGGERTKYKRPNFERRQFRSPIHTTNRTRTAKPDSPQVYHQLYTDPIYQIMEATFNDSKPQASNAQELAHQDQQRIQENQERAQKGEPQIGGSAGRAQVANADPSGECLDHP